MQPFLLYATRPSTSCTTESPAMRLGMSSCTSGKSRLLPSMRCQCRSQFQSRFCMMQADVMQIETEATLAFVHLAGALPVGGCDWLRLLWTLHTIL